jgi:hypothetical protein
MAEIPDTTNRIPAAPSALESGSLPACAVVEYSSSGPSGRSAASAPVGPNKHTFKFGMEPADTIAFAVFALAIAAALIAVIAIFALIFHRISEEAGLKLILGCVGGGTVAGIVSALMVHQRKTKGKK